MKNQEELVHITKSAYMKLLQDQTDLHIIRDWAAITAEDSFSYNEEVVNESDEKKLLRIQINLDTFMMPQQATQFNTLIKDIFTLRNPTKF